MSLEYRGSEVADYFGFFEFSEGREFLRSVLPMFQEETGFGDKKLASILIASDESDYEAEHAAVTQALKRWQRGQGDLWSTKPEKSRAYLMRLEREMMAFDTSRSILKGKAEALLTRQGCAGAAAFFYGADQARDSLDAIHLNQKDVAGIYQCLIKVAGVKIGDRVGNEIEEEWILRPVFHLLIAKEGAAHMEAHEFTLVPGEKPHVRHHRIGYAFALFPKRVHRLMVDVDDRDVRSHDVLQFDRAGDALADFAYEDVYSITKHYVQTEPAVSYVPSDLSRSIYNIKVDEFAVSVDDEMKALIENVKSNLASEIIF